MHITIACLCLAAAAATTTADASPVRLDVSSERSDYNLSTSADGQRRVFARSDAQFENARIFESVRSATGWSAPQPIAFTDTRWRDSDPWLTPDGRTLYFISDRPTPSRGERHDLDLWRAHRTDDGWSAPEHLGDAVNSVGEELGPELHGDTLYFASSRAGGLGGLDIYAARVEGGRIEAAQPLPAPLNSATSESDLTFTADGRTAVFWRVVDRRLLLHTAQRDGEGWSTPAPLGAAANPGPMQITPAFAADGRSLTFASDAPRAGQGAGLFDVYEVRWPLE
ncbi:TolB family protein [Cognatilysobacter bugurensis]|uniref:WD40 repeat protein n=1 Tax=Cognatilysobacter bugurensis TaxID=543356 RepID=A0A918SZ97_9GAMM|nr:PD40 domain-containing protein [Lysobacter bugurensis]GHA79530.1 hypothetical protein GCM10007067_16310 [Lysobacter bugurensis]